MLLHCLRLVHTSIYEPWDSIFRSFAGPDSPGLHCSGNSPLCHVPFFAVQSSFGRLLAYGMSSLWLVPSSFLLCSVQVFRDFTLISPVSTSGVAGTSVTLFTDTVVWILYSSILTVSSNTDMALCGRTVFDNTFVQNTFAMRPDSIICMGRLSKKKCCPELNRIVHRTVLSKVRL